MAGRRVKRSLKKLRGEKVVKIFVPPCRLRHPLLRIFSLSHFYTYILPPLHTFSWVTTTYLLQKIHSLVTCLPLICYIFAFCITNPSLLSFRISCNIYPCPQFPSRTNTTHFCNVGFAVSIYRYCEYFRTDYSCIIRA